MPLYRIKLVSEICYAEPLLGIYCVPYLELQYLWIDSLCIIQDDTEDLGIEFIRIASVYGGSHINLVASGGSDGSIGCLFDREKTWRCRVRSNSSDVASIYDCFP
jgi:hypothetical protein